MSFACSNPDFSIRCLPEDVSFDVQRIKLEKGSHIFADMFSCCDNSANPAGDDKRPVNGSTTKSMDIYETSMTFGIFLKLLHDPPAEYPKRNKSPESSKYSVVTPACAIPYPVLPLLYDLADKYAVSLPILQTLDSHLAAQVSTSPLSVYGLATRRGLVDIADEASAFLVQPPLHTYTPEELRIIPTAEAYQKLLLLQHHRTMKLKKLLMDEQLFPHGYGECTAHRQVATDLWTEKKRSLLGLVDAGTDIATEMSMLLERDCFSSCHVCRKACIAATDMLAYKCRKVARKISELARS